MKNMYVVPMYGMANKLRVIASSNEYAKRNNYNLIVLWYKDKSDNLDLCFTDKSKNIKIINDKCSLNLIEKQIENSFQNITHEQFQFIFSQDFLFRKFNIRNEYSNGWTIRNKNDDIFYKSCDQFNHIMKYDYDWLSFGQDIEDIAKDIILNEIKTNDYISVHIRKTDNHLAVKNTLDYLYENEIKKEIQKNPNIKIYIASDDNSTKKIFKEKYSENIIVRLDLMCRGDENFHIDSIVDFILLAKSKFIYKSKYSSFSKEAAIYGKTPYKEL